MTPPRDHFAFKIPVQSTVKSRVKTPTRLRTLINAYSLAAGITTLLGMLLATAGSVSASPGGIDKPCTPAEEYIRSSRYLRKQKHIELSEAETGKISEQVSLSCRGGARRFEDTIEVLSKAGYPAKVLIQTALDQSRSSDERTDLFLTVFQVTFARDGLDLTAQAALETSLRLTQSTRSDESSPRPSGDEREAILNSARKAFKEISLQCIKDARRGGWELPKSDCARLATDLALPILEGKLNGNRVPDTVREFVEFAARASDGPSFTLRASLDLSQELLSLSEEAALEYIKGWRHAVSEDGLKLPKNQASEFALRLVKQATSSPKPQPTSNSPRDQNR